MTVTPHLKIVWLDSGREPQCPSNPRYPNGIDIFAPPNTKRACVTTLPYPAPRCGVHLITCSLCGLKAAVTAAGRPDDPRSIHLPCRSELDFTHADPPDVLEKYFRPSKKRC